MWAVASFVSVGCDVRRRHAMMGPFYCVPEMQTEWTGMSNDGWWWVVVVAGGGDDVLEVWPLLLVCVEKCDSLPVQLTHKEFIQDPKLGRRGHNHACRPDLLYRQCHEVLTRY